MKVRLWSAADFSSSGLPVTENDLWGVCVILELVHESVSLVSAVNGFYFLSAGWHEELDRKLSQHSLGELTKFGSKTTLNRRVRHRVCVFMINVLVFSLLWDKNISSFTVGFLITAPQSCFLPALIELKAAALTVILIPSEFNSSNTFDVSC